MSRKTKENANKELAPRDVRDWLKEPKEFNRRAHTHEHANDVSGAMATPYYQWVKTNNGSEEVLAASPSATVTFDSEIEGENLGMWNSAESTSKFTARSSGIHHFTFLASVEPEEETSPGVWEYTTNDDWEFTITVWKNGVGTGTFMHQNVGDYIGTYRSTPFRFEASLDCYLAQGDYLQFVISHSNITASTLNDTRSSWDCLVYATYESASGGAVGPQGATGATGAAGANGADGADGADGVDGAQGPPGLPGDDGDPGFMAIPGPRGATGATGATGPAGADGADAVGGAGVPYFPVFDEDPWGMPIPGGRGADGAAGATGATGDTGATGATGPAGPRGAPGFAQDGEDGMFMPPIKPKMGDSVDVQVFTPANDGVNAWVRPTGALWVEVVAIGAGGGGGSGRKGAATRYGGGGGGGGAIVKARFNAADLTASEDVRVGTGGTGGAAQTTDSTNGTVGGDGESSYFGDSNSADAGTRWVIAPGGEGGARGTAVGGAGGAGGGNGVTVPLGADVLYGGDGGNGNGAGNGSAAVDIPISATLTNWIVGGAPGGGGGGGDTNNNGGDGGDWWTLAGGAGGVASTSDPVAGSSQESGIPYAGSGGGGGASQGAASRRAGANGGSYGAGGGGGASGTDATSDSGAGGNGANGIVIVTTYLEGAVGPTGPAGADGADGGAPTPPGLWTPEQNDYGMWVPPRGGGGGVGKDAPGVFRQSLMEGRAAWSFTDCFYGAVTGGMDGGWYYTGTTGAAAAFDSHPGVYGASTGTSTSGSAYISPGNAATFQPFGDGAVRAGFIFRSPSSLSDGTNTYRMRVGFIDTIPVAASDPTNFIGFDYKHDVNSGNWRAFVTGIAAQDTGVAVAATTWYYLEFIIAPDASKVDFYVNGVYKATVTGTLPSTPMFLMCGLRKGAGTSATIMYIDMGYFHQTFDTDRIP